MTIEQASTFLVGSILTAMGFIVIIAAAIFVNNILHKYWKPVKMFTPDSWKGFNPPAQESITLEKAHNERTMG
jgi:hypothetical protein